MSAGTHDSRHATNAKHQSAEALSALACEARLSPVLLRRCLELASGFSYREIAEANRISINTVKTEASNVLRALGLSCRHELQDAMNAANLRAECGATNNELLAFLRVRFE